MRTTADKAIRKSKQKSLVAGAPGAAVAAPVAQVAPAVGTAVPAPSVERVATVGLEGVTFNTDGKAVLMVVVDVPQPTMSENEKWPWTPWNIGYLRKQFEKDLRRVAQTVANFRHVEGILDARAAERASRAPASV